MDLGNDVMHGGCQCGAVRYRIRRSEILTVYCCHCLECQRQAASAFGLSVKLPRSAFTLASGRIRRWTRDTDRGGRSRAHFCQQCGTRVFHDMGDDAVMVSLKGGTLDEARTLTPIGHIWTDRAHDWVTFADDAVCYPEQPESYDALIAAWRTNTRAR